MYVSILFYNISIYYIIYLSFEKKKKRTTCKVFEKIDFRLVARNFFQIQWKLNYPCFHCPNTILSPRYKLLYGYVLNDMAYSPFEQKYPRIWLHSSGCEDENEISIINIHPYLFSKSPCQISSRIAFIDRVILINKISRNDWYRRCIISDSSNSIMNPINSARIIIRLQICNNSNCVYIFHCSFLINFLFTFNQAFSFL